VALDNMKITTYSDGVEELPDNPSDAGYTAAQLKAIFDARSNKEIKQKHNDLVDEVAAQAQAIIKAKDDAVKEALSQISVVQGPQGPRGEAGPEGSKGEKGVDGGYYIPNVKQDVISEMILSFTPSKEGMQEILRFNIMLPAGDNGYTPVREVDYWTEEDKAEIKSYVEEAILGGAW